MRFKYFSESDSMVAGECPSCLRVMQIRRGFLRWSGQEFIFSQPIACHCGAVLLGIQGKPQLAQPARKSALTKHDPNQLGSIGNAIIGVCTVILSIWLFNVLSCDGEPSVVQQSPEDLERMRLSREAEEYARGAADRRAQALAEVDAAISKANEELRAEFDKKSVGHRMYSRGAVRVDVYTMPDGRIVMCDTVVSDIGPTVSCDGSP